MVDYSDSWTEQGYHQSHDALLAMGADLSYEQFLHTWSSLFSQFNQQTAQNHHEFSMNDVATAFLKQVLERSPSSEEISTLVDTYGTEWNSGVIYPE